jgi:very-short-patch-repair endonuclease
MENVKINHVRSLRQNTTDAEKHLWHFLRARRFNNYKFRRQHLVYPYVVDFICLKKGLIIECDGGQHQEQQEYDEKRHQFLVSRGYKVLRFWNNTILRETSMVLEMILEVLEATSYP